MAGDSEVSQGWENETNMWEVLRRTDTAKLLWIGVEKSLATDAQ
jgi:hypothetical protein